MNRLTVTLLCFAVAAALLVLAAAAFMVWRAAVRKKLLTGHSITGADGIDEELILEIGGIKQFFYIRGQRRENPVILFLHGGPGGAMIPMLHTYQYDWEAAYTVVNWDQRGAGKTYFLNQSGDRHDESEITAELLLSDIHEIVRYLRGRFQKEKLILMGHSFGTILGARYALTHPEYVEAYIGAAQTVSINQGVIRMGEYVSRLAAAQHAKKEAAKLEGLLAKVRENKGIAQSETLAISKLARRYIPVDLDTTIFLRNGLFSPYYSLKDLTCYAHMEEMTKSLIEYAASCDLRTLESVFQVPVIFILGEQDWSMKLLAREYFDQLTAPCKKFITIPKAGHVVMMNQPKGFFDSFHRALMECSTHCV